MISDVNETEAALATMLLAVLTAGRLNGRRLLVGERVEVALLVMRLVHL